MASNNVTSAVFANAVPASTFHWAHIAIGLLLVAIVVAIAYFVYVNYMGRGSYHRNAWADLTTNSSTIQSTDAMVNTVVVAPAQQQPDVVSAVVSSITQPAASADHVTAQAVEPPNVVESWCFVGEDLSGRYCVKVPTTSACTKERVYQSNTDCQMAAANHMPAGIINSHDVKMKPLSTMNIM